MWRVSVTLLGGWVRGGEGEGYVCGGGPFVVPGVGDGVHGGRGGRM
jgi:hypothetical protein